MAVVGISRAGAVTSHIRPLPLSRANEKLVPKTWELF